MKKIILFSFIYFLALISLHAQAWDNQVIYDQAKKHLIALLSLDTSQPEPNETAAARYIYKELNKHHIDWEFLSPRKGSANLVARLPGSDPRKKPLLLLSHLDTASAADNWTYPPYKATLADGKIYGLGVTDAKNYTAMHLALFTYIKDNGLTPERDLIFLVTSGEENGSDTGLKWLGDNHWDKIAAGFALNEGGGIIKNTPQKHPLVFAEAGTKMYMDLKLTATGQALHSSLPVHNNAVYNLSQALAKLQQFNPSARITEATREFFRRIIPLQQEDGQTTIHLLLDGTAQERQMAADLMAQDPFFRSQLKDTLTPVMISSGTDTGASAAEASAVLNVRLLPDTNPEEFVKELEKFLGEDASLSLEILEQPQLPFPKPMKGNDELFASISHAAEMTWPGSVAVPGMSPASGDSEFLRRLGVVTYGLGPAMDSHANAPSAHAADEYLSEADYQEQVLFFTNVVRDFLFGPITQPAADPDK